MENTKIQSTGFMKRLNLMYLEAAVLTVLVIVIVFQHKTLTEVKKLNNQNNEKK